MQAGERIWNLQRLFNLREGATRKDDTLPPRIMKHAVPFPDGNSRAVDYLEPMLDDYYKQRGWDEQAQPTRRKLVELGLYKKKTITKRLTKRAHARRRKQHILHERANSR
jgi:aldehyde:ferredoxin oxidoreductase